MGPALAQGGEERTAQGGKTGPCVSWPLLLRILPFHSQARGTQGFGAVGQSWDRLLSLDIGSLALGRLLMAPLESAITPSVKATSLGGCGSRLAWGQKHERKAETAQQGPEGAAALPLCVQRQQTWGSVSLRQRRRGSSSWGRAEGEKHT